MKQFYIALSAALLLGGMTALSASAQTPDNHAKRLGNVELQKAPQRAPLNFSNREPVTTYTGTLAPQVMSGYAMYPDESGEYLMGLQYDGKQTSIATDTEGNKLYIFNPFSHQPSSSYIVGDIKEDEDGNTIAEFTFPQPLYRDVPNDPTTTYFACVMGPLSDGSGYAPMNKQTMQFIKEGDDWVMQLPTSSAIIGIVDDSSTWYFLGERNVRYTPFTDKLVTPPADFQATAWDMVYRGTTGHKVNVGFSGNEVYIQGVSPDFPKAWIKGVVDGDKINFDRFQYVGLTPGGYYAWVVGGTPYGDDLEHFAFDETFVMNYDETNDTFSYPNWLIVESSKTFSLTLGRYKEPVFTDASTLAGSLQPAQPVVTYFYPKIGKWGMTWFEADIPSVSVSGRLLDQSNLYYKVYLDGEVHTFDNFEWYNITEPLTLIPWGFTDDWRIETDLEHIKITLDFGGVETIQIESIYYTGNEELHQLSEVFETGVESIDAEEVYSYYTDLCGCVVENPTEGIYVKTVVYSNGTRRSSKVMVK